jgi:hypothetical protein
MILASKYCPQWHRRHVILRYSASCLRVILSDSGGPPVGLWRPVNLGSEIVPTLLFFLVHATKNLPGFPGPRMILRVDSRFSVERAFASIWGPAGILTVPCAPTGKAKGGWLQVPCGRRGTHGPV